jgi:hypothetical protein
MIMKIKRLFRSIGLVLVAVIAITIITLIFIDGTFLPKKYLEPWDKSYHKKYTDPRVQVIAHGLLAPSAHNRQSWKIRLDTEDKMAFILYMDSNRLLPHSDPYWRQVTMSQGTFLENIRIGALALGYETDLVLFPDGEYDAKGTLENIDKHPVAKVILRKSTPVKEPLYDAITRATAKAAFLDTPLAESAKEALIKANSDSELHVSILTKPQEVERIRQLTIDAMSIDLKVNVINEGHIFRFTEWKKNEKRDGLTFNPLGFSKPQQFFMQALGSLIPVSEETMVEMGKKGFSDAVATIPAYIMIISDGNSRSVQVKAGMLYARLSHMATLKGFSMAPAEQALQEYPEMAELYEKVHKTYADKGQTIQMLAGMGKLGKEIMHSPRRDVMDIIIK